MRKKRLKAELDTKRTLHPFYATKEVWGMVMFLPWSVSQSSAEANAYPSMHLGTCNWGVSPVCVMRDGAVYDVGFV